MGPRKPTALLSSIKHNSGRYADRANEPQIVAITSADPPDYFDAKQRECWQVVMELTHPGTLSKSDLLLIEHAAQLLHRMRKNNWNVNPAVMVRFETVLAKLGMTPADRSRVAVIKQKTQQQNAVDEFKRVGNA